ncbi:hypothetical protein SUGI_0493860 [Cryptomeria japonica]|nr:hypothetical protein SUGI_0493860 [Cryptomeria japonica]
MSHAAAAPANVSLARGNLNTPVHAVGSRLPPLPVGATDGSAVGVGGLVAYAHPGSCPTPHTRVCFARPDQSDGWLWSPLRGCPCF